MNQLFIPFKSWHGWRTAVFSTLFSTTIVAYLWPHLGNNNAYREPVVGNTAWQALDKAKDYQAVYLLIGITILVFYIVQSIYELLSRHDAEVISSLHKLLDITVIPFMLWLGVSLATTRALIIPSNEWMAAASVAIILFVILVRFRGQLKADLVLRVGYLYFANLFLSFFAGLALAQAWSLWRGGGVGFGYSDAYHHSLHLARQITYGTLIAAWAILITFLLISRQLEAVEKNMRKLLFGLQFFLPLLFLSVLPSRLFYLDRAVSPHFSRPLLVCLIVTMMAAWWRLFKRIQQFASVASQLTKLYEPLCLAGIAVYWNIQTNYRNFYPTFILDDFHVGEQLLPWQQLTKFGRIPYVDFAPVHSLMPFLTGSFNWFFYDGTLAHFSHAEVLLQAIAIAVTFLVVYLLTDVHLALLCCVILTPLDRLYFMAPAILILGYPGWFAKRLQWLIGWLAVSAFTASYNPSIGAAFCIASLPLALWQGYSLYKENKKQLIRLSIVVASIASVLLIVPVSRKILFGYILFIWENGITNSFAHAASWSSGFELAPYSKGILSSAFVFEGLRFLWIPVVIFAIFQFLRQLATVKQKPVDHRLFLYAATACVFVLLSPWSLGRIDPGAMSRPGYVSVVAAGTIFPVLLYIAFDGIKTVGYIALSAYVGIFGVAYNYESYTVATSLVQSSVRMVSVPDHLQYYSGKDIGFPNLGNLYSDPSKIEELKSFQSAVEQVVGPQETYLDFTNQQARYFYLNKPVPTLYATTYIAVNRMQQNRMLQTLRQNSPPAIFAYPAPYNWDGGPPNLRSYYLYRWAIQNYHPVQVGQFVFLIRNSENVQATGQNLDLLSKPFLVPPLEKIPQAWGNSWGSLQKQFQVVDEIASSQPFTARDNTNSIVEFSHGSISGLSADFLLVDLKTAGKYKAQSFTLIVGWQSELAKPIWPIQLVATEGKLLIPLGASPNWLLSRDIRHLELYFGGLYEGQTVEIRQIQLLKLRESL